MGVWQLLKKSRKLLVPDGAVIELTAGEYDLLCCLSEGPHTVSRDVLQATLRQGGSAGTVRALESLVRRTRKKIAGHTRHRVPILSNYGMGYAFAAKLIVIP
jgi:DNA-binding response OmpR family regulator